MKYKVGQKVKIRSLEWYQDNVNRYGIIECGKYEFFEPMNEYCGKVVTIKRIDDDNYRIDTDKGAFCWTDEMIEGLVEEETKLDIDKVMEEHQKIVDEIFEIQGIEPIEAEEEHIVHCPEGYQFVDENGNVINAKKIVLEKKKKEYPKTYEECCRVLEIRSLGNGTDGYKWEILSTFQNLIIYRDAYWKIAGEEVGLGKPWKPDWKDDEKKYTIEYYDGEIIKDFSLLENRILIFPTEEMRDTFYENFKELIEMCKELL